MLNKLIGKQLFTCIIYFEYYFEKYFLKNLQAILMLIIVMEGTNLINLPLMYIVHRL